MICVSGLLPPEKNNNLVIERFIVDGFSELIGADCVTHTSSRLASSLQCDTSCQLILGVGSVADQSSRLLDLRRLADRTGCPLALWLVDDPYELDFRDQALSLADHVFTVDGSSVEYYESDSVSHLMLAGSKKAHFQPVHKDRPTSFDLSFCGVGFKNRRSLVDSISSDRRFLEYKVGVFGSHWNESRIATNRRLSPAENRLLTTRSRMVLNMGRDYNIANHQFEVVASSPGPRTFEVALQGVPQVYALFGYEMDRYFRFEDEILVFDRPGDLHLLLERSREEPDWLVGVAERAQRKALEHHTYTVRAAQILDSLNISVATQESRS